MKSADNINEQIQNLKTQASDELDKKIHTAIDNSLAQAEHQPNIWRIIMKSKITKLAIAATVIIIAAIAVIHFSGGRIDVATPAFANVMEQIYKAKNVTYKKTMITPKVNFTSTDTAVESGLLRGEMPYDTIILFDFTNGINMTLFPTQKKCYINRTIGRHRTALPFSWLNWIQKMHHNPAEYSHSEVLDEKNVDVYLIEVPYEKTTIWVDPQTDLPVKIVMEDFPNKEADVVMPSYSLNKSDFGSSYNESTAGSICSGRGSGAGISEKTTQIMTDFVWDKELDESMFTFEPPDDWEVVEKQQQDKEIEKGDLIKALSFWTQMSDGYFPEKINDLMDPNLLNPLLIEKYNTGGDPDEQFDQARAEAITVIRGLYFAQEKKVDNNWYYAGAGAIFGDSEIPIAWWQNEDQTWTIIYADLSLDENAEEPPPINEIE